MSTKKPYRLDNCSNSRKLSGFSIKGIPMSTLESRMDLNQKRDSLEDSENLMCISKLIELSTLNELRSFYFS